MKSRLILPPQQLLHNLFSYCEDNTAQPLAYKIKPSKNIAIGRAAGSYSKGIGYYQITILKTNYFLHRVIFQYHNGWCPDYIDHKDCDPSNNIIANLRESTCAQNLHSSPHQSNNTTGYKGVSWFKKNKRYVAGIKFNGRRIHLGYFDCPEEAHEAYKAKAVELYGEYAHW
jgi:hypothetical protein